MSSAVGYVRVSTEDQAREGVSLDAQEERLRDYCATHNLNLVSVCRDEGVSATEPFTSRPQGRLVLEQLQLDQVDQIVAFKLDRLFRDTLDGLKTMRSWRDRQVALHLVEPGRVVRLDDPQEWLLLTILLAVAEFEAAAAASRTRAALAHLKRGGARLGGRAVDNPEAIALVLELSALGLSSRQICEDLEASGLQSARGGRWSPSVVLRLLRRAGAGGEGGGQVPPPVHQAPDAQAPHPRAKRKPQKGTVHY